MADFKLSLRNLFTVGIFVIVIAAFAVTAVLTRSDHATAQPTTYSQDLWLTGTSGSVDAQTKRTGNDSSNNMTDPHWQINRIYSDAFIPNTPPPAGSDPNATFGSSICQYYTGTSPRNAVVVSERQEGVNIRAALQPAGTSNEPGHPIWGYHYPWVASPSVSRWLGLDHYGWHNGYGGGKPPAPAGGCRDPSSPVYGSSGTEFPTLDRWHSYVFRYALPVDFPADVDLSTLRIEMEGAADNHLGVTVNNQAMNIACAGRGVNEHQNQYFSWGDDSRWGQGDPNVPGTAAYLPFCTPSPDFNSVNNPMNATIMTSTAPFVRNGNVIEIHIKSAYSNMGLILTKMKIVGNHYTPVTVSGRVHNAYNTSEGYNGVPIDYDCDNIADVTTSTIGGVTGKYEFTVPVGTSHCVRVLGNPAGSVRTNVRPTGEGYDPSCGAYSATAQSPDYCANVSTYEWQRSGGQDNTNEYYSIYDRLSDTDFNFALRYPPIITCSITSNTSIKETTLPFSVTVNVSNTGTSTKPPVSGTVTLAITGQANRQLSYGSLATSTSTDPDLSFTNIIINTPGAYTITASATGKGDDIDIATPPQVCTGNTSVKIGEYPYLKEFGGDVWAGGNFSNVNSCAPPSNSPGNIFAFNESRGTNLYAGASAQLTVTALMTINQFSSASNRAPATGSNTYGPKGLTYSNIGAGTPGFTYGGGYDEGGTRCITNFFDDTKDSTLAVNLAANPFPPAPATPPTQVISNVISSSTLSTRAGDDVTPNMRLATIRDGISNRWGFNEWASTGGQAGTWVRMTWSSDQEFTSVRIWDRVNPIDRVTSGTLTFESVAAGASCPARNFGALSDGVGDYDPNHIPTEVTIPANCRARGIVMTITGVRAGTLNAGISEIEVNAVTATLPGGSNFLPGRKQYVLPAGNLTITNPLEIPTGSQAAVYVDGNVYINNNITFGTGYGSIAQMPYFAMIVKGNIYIDKNVTRLDGLYVAQPDGATNSGTIYTCATALNTPCSAANVHDEGQKQLAVNGSLVANRIKFLRTYKSLRDAAFAEIPNFATGLSDTTNPIDAAEVINYTAQMYLAPSPLHKPSVPAGGYTGSSGPYDAIRSLPPIF